MKLQYTKQYINIIQEENEERLCYYYKLTICYHKCFLYCNLLSLDWKWYVEYIYLNFEEV